ncbi:hypothetical protein EON63_25205, partial [archaeon]
MPIISNTHIHTKHIHMNIQNTTIHGRSIHIPLLPCSPALPSSLPLYFLEYIPEDMDMKLDDTLLE